MDEKIYHKQLVDRYTSKTASDDELMVFVQLLKEGKLDEYLGKSFTAAAGNDGVQAEQQVSHVDPQGSDLHPLPELPRIFRYRPLMRVAVAASIIGIISLAIFLFTNNKETPEKSSSAIISQPPAHSPEILPGGDRATLMLADGSSIVLDSAANGKLATQNNLSIVKTTSGTVEYQNSLLNSGGVSRPPSEEGVGYTTNTLTTPRGGQYQLVLPDGTHVWLNAASTITYSIAFNPNKRIVQLDGEAYFEVARNTSMPFIVQMKNGVNVHVLGTNFNVYCYNNEPVKMTLLQGSIRVQSPQRSAVLNPGQEATVQKDGNLDIAHNADTEEAVAWKNGLFEFNRADITTIMRQIERWYDVEVVYEGERSDKQFVGKVPRNSNLSEVLGILELSKIHFRVDGRKVIIY